MTFRTLGEAGEITGVQANKGGTARTLGAILHFDRRRATVVGQMTNPVAMVQAAGFAVATGHAPDMATATVGVVATPNRDEGRADAVDPFARPRRPAPPVAS
ncbi:HAD hydrolase family protein [Phenylobacterium sp.]|uniref:HAD hydrolase family protein n=1 Tax=Phenylobacterium sp. TaxID=1871053 RepID=UPI00286A6FC6|nr:HAD hydrolase family protein [Phenylobacterium sp.]